MLAWLFELKIFSPTISDPSTFFFFFFIRGARWLSGRVLDPEREVGGSKPTTAVLCPWARHFTPRKYWLITQEAVAPFWHDWKIVDWDDKPQHKHFFYEKKNYFFIKKLILKGIPVEKLAMQNFIFTASIKCKFTYTTFLTAEDNQIWHNFINILLCSIIIIK